MTFAMTLFTRTLLILSLLTLGGCASLPEAPESSVLPSSSDALEREAKWQERQRILQKIETWRSEGRAAILTENGGGQISFDWLYSPKDQVLSIKTPLGQNAMQLTINSSGATLIGHEGQVMQGENGETLLQEALGWSVPLESLRAWLLGLPSSRHDLYTLDPQGRLNTLESKGWHIQYKNYDESAGLSLPSKLELRHSELTLRLVIDRWTL